MSNSILKNFKLIDGSFSKTDALIVLKDIFDAKIKFHKLQSIAKIDVDINNVHSLNNYRMQQLVKEKETMQSFLEALPTSNCDVQITSTINIKVT